MEKKTLLFIIIFLVFLSLSFLFGLIFFILVFSTGGYSNENSNIQNPKTYQYMELSLGQKKTKFGISTMNKRISKGEYISYSNEDTGGYVIISNLGGDQYVCSGSCLCESPERRSTTTLVRGVGVVLSAFSAAVAMKIAKEAFEDQCMHHYTDNCEYDDLVADIRNCEKLETGEELEELKDGFERWDCSGYCTINEDLPFEEKLDELDQPNCENMLTNRVFQIESGDDILRRAKKQFNEDTLKGFCKAISFAEFITGGFEQVPVNLCKAASDDDPDPKTISCLPYGERVDPEEYKDQWVDTPWNEWPDDMDSELPDTQT